MAKKPLRVVPDNGMWKVKGGTGVKNSRHRKKNRAVKMAKKRGRQNGYGVIIHRKDGTVQYGYSCDTSGSRAKLVRSS